MSKIFKVIHIPTARYFYCRYNDDIWIEMFLSNLDKYTFDFTGKDINFYYGNNFFIGEHSHRIKCSREEFDIIEEFEEI